MTWYQNGQGERGLGTIIKLENKMDVNQTEIEETTNRNRNIFFEIYL